MSIRSGPAVLACVLFVSAVEAQTRQIAITIDDLPTTSVVGNEIGQAERVTRDLVAALVRHKVPAIGFVDDLARMLSRRGYRFISLDDALKDEAYASPDRYYGPAGITWLHRWAITAGKPGAIFVGEPRVPEWIEQMAR